MRGQEGCVLIRRKCFFLLPIGSQQQNISSRSFCQEGSLGEPGGLLEKPIQRLLDLLETSIGATELIWVVPCLLMPMDSLTQRNGTNSSKKAVLCFDTCIESMSHKKRLSLHKVTSHASDCNSHPFTGLQMDWMVIFDSSKLLSHANMAKITTDHDWHPGKIEICRCKDVCLGSSDMPLSLQECLRSLEDASFTATLSFIGVFNYVSKLWQEGVADTGSLSFGKSGSSALHQYAVSSSAWVLTEARQKGTPFWSVWSLKGGTWFARVIILFGEAILPMPCWRQAKTVFITANGLQSLCWHHNCLGSCGLFINIDESIDSQVDRQQWQCRLCTKAKTLVHWASLWSASLEYANCKEDC